MVDIKKCQFEPIMYVQKRPQHGGRVWVLSNDLKKFSSIFIIFLLIYINSYQFTPISIDLHQFTPISIDLHQFINRTRVRFNLSRI